MGKTVDEKELRMLLRLTKTDEEEEVTCRVDYKVSAEDITESRSFDATLTTAQEKTIKQLRTSVLGAIKQKEA